MNDNETRIRLDEIQRSFLGSDRIWPPGAATETFKAALVEVLSRLPDDAYDHVDNSISFVVAHPNVWGVNVPIRYSCSPSPTAYQLNFDTVVLFESGLALPARALVGLLAHELAHSFVSGADYASDEIATDAIAESWGFGAELQALEECKN